MKTLKKIAAIMILPFILYSFTDKKIKREKSEKPAEYTNVALNIIGYIENAGFDFKNAKYRLYRDNRFVSGGITDRFGTMELYLMRNSNYLLEFSAAGFVSKKIYISTFVPDEYKDVGYFDFGISLIPMDFLPEEEICAFDSPYAFVYFNENREFDYDEQYTQQMMEMEEEFILK